MNGFTFATLFLVFSMSLALSLLPSFVLNKCILVYCLGSS